MKKILLTALLGLIFADRASASLITFDDISGTIDNGYAGLDWDSFNVLNGDTYQGGNSGYGAGVISHHNVAFNAGGALATISDGTFTLNSAYLTAAWNDNLQVQVIGKLGGVTLYNNLYTLSATTPTLINFNYLGIDSVQFNSFGGTLHSGYNGGGNHFAMDNLTVNAAVPEPSTFIAGALLGLPFGMQAIRQMRRRKQAA